MKAKAMAKFVGYPVNKVRLVLDAIKGKSAEDAIQSLEFMPNFAAVSVKKTLKSAVANLVDTHRDENVNTSEIFVSKMFANEGPTMKRIKHRAQGRATRIRKRTSHIFIEVSTK